MMLRGLLLVLISLLLGLGLLTCVKSPNLTTWKLAILATEYGHWLAFATGIVLAGSIPLFKISSGLGRTFLFLGGAAMILFLKPAFQAWRMSGDLPARLEKSFGGTSPARPAFSWWTLFRGYSDLAGGDPRSETRVFARPETDTPLSLDFTYAAVPSGPAPCVVVVHGGGWDSGDRAQFGSFNAYLARRGFAVAAIEYRLAPRFVWPAAREDTVEAIRYLREHHRELGIDPDKIVLFGRSAGGQIAESVAYDRAPPGVCGVIAWYAPADLYFAWLYTRENDLLNSFLLMRQYTGGTPETAREQFDGASPFRHVGPRTLPTLLAHGQLDGLVWHRQSARLNDRLVELGRPVVFLDLPWATHAFDFNSHGPGGQLGAFALEWFVSAVTR